jgi:hypothetical protein
MFSADWLLISPSSSHGHCLAWLSQIWVLGLNIQVHTCAHTLLQALLQVQQGSNDYACKLNHIILILLARVDQTHWPQILLSGSELVLKNNCYYFRLKINHILITNVCALLPRVCGTGASNVHCQNYKISASGNPHYIFCSFYCHNHSINPFCATIIRSLFSQCKSTSKYLT